MKYVFDIEETLCRRVTIDTDTLANAIEEITYKLDEEEIVLDATDFVGGELRMPLENNFLPYLEVCGNQFTQTEDMDIILEIW